MSTADAVVIGGGIVGASCAYALSREGVRVTLLEAGPIGGGATAAGMGHIVVMDDNEPEFQLTKWSRDLWLELSGELPLSCEFGRSGTIWVAADEEEFEAVGKKHAGYAARGVRTEILDGRQLRAAEPNLRDGLAGGLLVPDDAVLYAPAAAEWLVQKAKQCGASVRIGTADEITHGAVRMANGERVSCGTVICANGCAAAELLSRVPVRPRKGHLVITDRYRAFVRHQLVELGYLKSAHGVSRESVAFNAQPRATGQVLLGSSRQFGDDSTGIDWEILRKMLQRAFNYMPGLRTMSVIRAWTGFRAASPDGLPLIGPYEGMQNLLLATGHEGLGITTSLATGELIASIVTGKQAQIPDTPFRPGRFAMERAHV